jgi:hypothetical protein
MSAPRRHRRPLAAALAAAALLLGACTPEVPQVREPAAPAAPPAAVQPVQTERILTDLAGQLTAAAETGDLTGASRLAGIALTMRTVEYRMRAADPEATPDQLGTDFAGTIVAATETWPRSFLALTRPVDAGAQHAYLLTQAAPRAQYQMVAWVRLVAGVALPGTNPPEQGSAPIAPEAADGLALSPAEALAAYAEAKDSVDQTDARFTAEDPARESWGKYITGWGSALEPIKGKVDHSSAPTAEAPVSFATADGGAIVLGAIDSTLVLSFTPTGAGESINLPERIAALGDGTTQVTSQATISFAETVALYVPPADKTDEPITVLGVYQVPTGVVIAPPEPADNEADGGD